MRRALILLAAGAALLGAGAALAQTLSLDLGAQGTLTGRIVQLILLVTVLSLAPAMLVTLTSFTRIVVVMSMLRTALGTQQAPPNMVVIALSLFLTAFIMQPTLEQSYNEGIKPLVEEEIGEMEAFERAMKPFSAFMLRHARDKDIGLFLGMARIETPARAEDTPLRVLIPAFMISELRRAFEIGFLLFIPFLVIDMVVASVLMSMGMMMLPPVMVSLPFKLIFFVLVDGWNLVAGSLVQSFSTGG
ncbi:MAG: flagellar type III secretion system pore protein FliP [Alphaproteobacteria bacterium]|nr:flagellar type III secretion system pore protein FliP [Alphaproteobacteria bacterium]